MGKYFPPLPLNTFNTIHWLVLEYLDAVKDKGLDEGLKELAPDILEAELTVNELVSYMLDRMIVDRGEAAVNRGNIFLKMEKKFKQDIDRLMTETVAKAREENPDLTKEELLAVAHTGLLLTNYFPLAASMEEEKTLAWVLPE